MISRDTLLIRHLPPDLSLEEKEDLLKHFGATHVKCISSKVKKNNITFARFDGEDSAKQALSRLHQLDVLGFPLVVQFARGRSGQDFNLEKKHTAQVQERRGDTSAGYSRKEEEIQVQAIAGEKRRYKCRL
uniref:RNA-binding region-containing protein 3 n=1 Tax=Timema douglasi TaxID=61478 RepID=A0A7R8VVK0_TIMDO|nr:unnamed protein product [Timema douglasi]